MGFFPLLCCGKTVSAGNRKKMKLSRIRRISIKLLKLMIKGNTGIASILLVLKTAYEQRIKDALYARTVGCDLKAKARWGEQSEINHSERKVKGKAGIDGMGGQQLILLLSRS